MKSFLAKSDRQLGICIRMLNDEGFNDLMIHSEKNAKSRMPNCSPCSRQMSIRKPVPVP